MKVTKFIIAGALALSATLTQASTVLTPTNLDVNFYVEDVAAFQLAIFNDDEAVVAGAQISGTASRLDVIITPSGTFLPPGGLIQFTGFDLGAGAYQAKNGLVSLDLDAINDDFIVGISTDMGLTWFADTGFVQGSANSLQLNFAMNGATIAVDVITAVPVPAAAWLFGSGLIGLVGIARRRAA